MLKDGNPASALVSVEHYLSQLRVCMESSLIHLCCHQYYCSSIPCHSFVPFIWLPCCEEHSKLFCTFCSLIHEGFLSGKTSHITQSTVIQSMKRHTLLEWLAVKDLLAPSDAQMHESGKLFYPIAQDCNEPCAVQLIAETPLGVLLPSHIITTSSMFMKKSTSRIQ